MSALGATLPRQGPDRPRVDHTALDRLGQAAAASRAAPVDGKAWMAVLGSTLGAFMAVLNIQITNASLPDIQGAIGAGIDDGGWISTAYLVAEIIVIPMTGFLSQVFSLRRYLIANTALFLIFSIACAFATDLGQMIVLRACQGFAGGVLIPMAFTIIITRLPRPRQPLGLAMFALSATFAPAIGPTIGGYLTDNYGWEFIFYVNLVPGIVMLALLWLSLEPAAMDLKRLGRGDWGGIVTMAIGLGTLQTALEEGNKDDWFGSPFILRLAIIAGLALSLFLVIELRVKEPLLNLRLFLRRNFALASVSNVLLGLALYGSVFLLPLYLSQMQGYDAQQIGEVLAWTGLPQLLLIPLVPRLMRRFDARLLIVFGLILFAGSNLMNIWLDPSISGDQFLLPNLVRAVGQALVMTPLSAIASAGIEKENAGSASALFNMMRNLGGAIGIALLQTFLTQREQYHSMVNSAAVSLLEPATQSRLAQLKQYFLAHGVADPATAGHEAVIAIGRTVRAQSFFQAYGDCFFLMGAALLIAALAATLLVRPAGPASGAGAH
jgi:MFS transporter, DHA2 family, multidrug resistance protein